MTGFYGKPIPKEQSLQNLKTRPLESGESLEGRQTSAFLPRDPLFNLSQIILPASVKEQLGNLKSRIFHHHLIYEEWGFKEVDPQGKSLAFNFFGPPGTGKTMCVEALAQELGKTVIDVSYAEIESKFVGETGKNIVAAFAAATKSESLLFFDEADSILGKRMTSVTQAADHGVNVSRAVMLKQLDAFDGVVAFATNLIRNFDEAFMRRIAFHIEIPLPDLQGRERLFQKMFPSRVPGRDNLDFGSLAEASEGLSGGDIKNAVLNSLAWLATQSQNQRILPSSSVLTQIKSIQNSKAHRKGED